MDIQLKEFRQTLKNSNMHNVHALVEDIQLVAEYIDSQTGDLSTIPEDNLVDAIKALTQTVNELKAKVETHVERVPETDIE